MLIPAYNPGPLLRDTVREVLDVWNEVLVVVDGSSDGSDTGLEALASEPGQSLRVLRLADNGGKGAAVLAGIEHLHALGFTHALTMDADRQHPASSIAEFVGRGRRHPDALVLGAPVFDASAPALRVQGRKLSNGMAALQTLGWGIRDALFGMRLYPIAPLRAAFAQTRGARHFDFDPEVAVRMAWLGVPITNIATPVRYLDASEGGVSQFRYLRDNTLLVWMNLRLLSGFALRLPRLLLRAGNPLKGS